MRITFHLCICNVKIILPNSLNRITKLNSIMNRLSHIHIRVWHSWNRVHHTTHKNVKVNDRRLKIKIDIRFIDNNMWYEFHKNDKIIIYNIETLDQMEIPAFYNFTIITLKIPATGFLSLNMWNTGWAKKIPAGWQP